MITAFARLRWRWYIRGRAMCAYGPLEGSWLKRDKTWSVFRLPPRLQYIVLELDSKAMHTAVKSVFRGEAFYPGVYRLEAETQEFRWHRNTTRALTGRRGDLP